VLEEVFARLRGTAAAPPAFIIRRFPDLGQIGASVGFTQPELVEPGGDCFLRGEGHGVRTLSLLKEVVALAAASLFHPGQMFLPFCFRDTSSDVSEGGDAFFFLREMFGAQCSSSFLCPLVRDLVSFYTSMAGNPTELGGPPCLAKLSFSAKDPAPPYVVFGPWRNAE
jgi:hypothetical protein